MKIPVTVMLTNPADDRAVIGSALAAKLKPRRWRPSEYACTKMAARRAADVVMSSPTGTADYFDWSCLLGEIARLWKYASKYEEDAGVTANVFRFFLDLQQQCMANPEAAREEASSQAYQKAQRQLRRAARKIEQMTMEYRQREMELESWHRRNGPGASAEHGSDHLQSGPVVRRER